MEVNKNMPEGIMPIIDPAVVLIVSTTRSYNSPLVTLKLTKPRIIAKGINIKVILLIIVFIPL